MRTIYLTWGTFAAVATVALVAATLTAMSTREDAHRQVRLLADIKSEMAEAQRSLEKSRLSFAQAEAASKTAAAAAMSAQGSLREQQVASDRAAKEKEAGAAGTRTRGSRAARPDPALPAVYLLTPTYARLTQKVDLVRMHHTLLLVPNVHWIVIEDSEEKTPMVTRFLAASGIPYTHVAARTPPEHRLALCEVVDKTKGCPEGTVGKLEASWMKPRGVAQRNAGLAALKSLNPATGSFYFADDDNTYSLELFEEIRKVKTVSVWHVGLSGGLVHEGPVLENGKVVDWHVGWRPSRPFPIDMAAFAINVRAIHDHPDLRFVSDAPRGFLESTFLQQIVPGKEDVDVVVPDCSCVLVWHTRTEKPLLNRERKTPSDAAIEV